MLKKFALLFVAVASLAACSTAAPKVVQTGSNTPDIHLTVGMATQIELPDENRIQTLTVGNPELLAADQATDVVNLVAKGGTGETNLIIRARDASGKAKVYTYRVVIEAR